MPDNADIIIVNNKVISQPKNFREESKKVKKIFKKL